jgi:hypothetical protein
MEQTAALIVLVLSAGSAGMQGQRRLPLRLCYGETRGPWDVAVWSSLHCICL